jgi:hypothetical protein
MADFLRAIINIMYTIHREITQLNDVYLINMSDKQLHFWVFGFVSIILFFMVHVVFKWLSKRSILAISFIYTLTIAIVLAFAIEIGQFQSKTGNMEFADILYGLYGFVFMFVVGLLGYYLLSYLNKLWKNR